MMPYGDKVVDRHTKRNAKLATRTMAEKSMPVKGTVGTGSALLRRPAVSGIQDSPSRPE